MNWKLITDKAPDYVIVMDMDNKTSVYAGKSTGTDLETAKLIAAAPELLTALHNAIVTLETINSLPNVNIATETIKEGLAAIKAATI